MPATLQRAVRSFIRTIDVCSDAYETIYSTSIYFIFISHHLVSTLHQPLCPCLPANHLYGSSRQTSVIPQPAKLLYSTQLYNNYQQHYLHYQPSILHWLASM